MPLISYLLIPTFPPSPHPHIPPIPLCPISSILSSPHAPPLLPHPSLPSPFPCSEPGSGTYPPATCACKWAASVFGPSLPNLPNLLALDIAGRPLLTGPRDYRPLAARLAHPPRAHAAKTGAWRLMWRPCGTTHATPSTAVVAAGAIGEEATVGERHRPSTPSLAHTRTRPFTSLQGPGTGDCLLAIPSTLCLRLSLTDLPGRRCIQEVGGGGGEHDLLYLPSLLPYAMDFPPAADLRIEFLAQAPCSSPPTPTPRLPLCFSARAHSAASPLRPPPLIVLERICTGPLPTGQGTTFPIPFLPYYLSLHFPLQTLLTCAPPSSRLPLALPHITPGGGVLRVLHDRAGHYKRTSRFIVLEVRHSGGGEA
ncbi:unnamed protein product [Closterium sp. NIES-65]|nr:unnamed protein product [Closterium sp. NIES-65]